MEYMSVESVSDDEQVQILEEGGALARTRRQFTIADEQEINVWMTRPEIRQSYPNHLDRCGYVAAKGLISPTNLAKYYKDDKDITIGKIISRMKAFMKGRPAMGRGRPPYISEEGKASLLTWLESLEINDRTMLNLLKKAAEIKQKEDNLPQLPEIPTSKWGKMVTKDTHKLVTGLPLPPERWVTKEEMVEWYEHVESALEMLEEDVPAGLIYNCDETMLDLKNKRKAKFFVKRSFQKSARYRGSYEIPFHVTLLPFISADGERIDNWALISKFVQFLHPEDARSYHQLKTYSANSGWMDYNTFYTVIKDIFIPGVIKKRVDMGLPANTTAILYTDGHGSRYNPFLWELLRQNNILLIILPPHSTHLMQPLDVAIFKAFKDQFRHFMGEQCPSTTAKPSSSRLRNAICRSVLNARDKTLYRDKVAQSFVTAGLHPLSSKVILEHSQFSEEINCPAQRPSTRAYPYRRTGVVNTEENRDVLAEVWSTTQVQKLRMSRMEVWRRDHPEVNAPPAPQPAQEDIPLGQDVGDDKEDDIPEPEVFESGDDDDISSEEIEGANQLRIWEEDVLQAYKKSAYCRPIRRRRSKYGRPNPSAKEDTEEDTEEDAEEDSKLSPKKKKKKT